MGPASNRSDHDERVREVAAYIEAHADEPLTLAELGRLAGLSASHLQREFTRVVGTSPKRYQTALRVEGLKDRLRAGTPVMEAAFDAGFGSARGAYEATMRHAGMTPGAYRRRGAGLDVRYAIAPSPLGLVLVGATPAGVCAVMIADSEPELLSALDREFGAARLCRDDAGLARQTAAVVDYTGGGGAEPALALDLQGTEFQQRVWTALRSIPSGSTVTYGELAKAIGRPSAQRAVAGACAGNHVALLVPCHRVVRGDGDLGGYKWGVDRKRALIEREATNR